jgi:serine/threonine-protein kinase
VRRRPWEAVTAARDFGDFELLEEIGRGGMGLVFKARQRSLNRIVALKRFRSDRPASPGDVQRFRDEANIVALLDHPNIVPIYDVGEHGRELYLCLKWMEGGSLIDHLPRFRRDVRAAACLVAVAARAVHHAHQRGVLHRDLKPSNILLDARGQPHVADFGLARRIGLQSELTYSGQMIRTPSYMAPEQTLGRRTRSPPPPTSTAWARLYALLTGGRRSAARRPPKRCGASRPVPAEPAQREY